MTPLPATPRHPPPLQDFSKSKSFWFVCVKKAAGYKGNFARYYTLKFKKINNLIDQKIKFTWLEQRK
jgi:hypothetical protein